jgi:O-antigen ligase/polysaccharide polymerase Wzy-like membrane protein
MPAVLVAASLALVAWGALAFGAVYPWAWHPLIAGALVVGASALAVARRNGASSRGMGVLWALLVVALAASLQLVPLSVSWRQALSPATESYLLAHDLAYTVAPGPRPLSINPAMTLRGIVLLGGFLVWLAGLMRLFNLTGATRAAGALSGLGVVLALIGIIQLALLGQDAYTGMRIYGFWKPRNLLTTPFGPFVNKNHFAGWMVMVMPLAAGYAAGLAERGLRGVRATWRDRFLWLSSRDGGRVQLIGFALLLMGVSLTLTRSRSGLAAFLVAMFLFTIVAARRSGSVKLAALTSVGLAVFAAVVVFWAGVNLQQRFGSTNEAVALRRNVWHDAARVVSAFPLTGSGLNTFGTAMFEYQTSFPDQHVQEAHNDYLQLAAEGGLLLGIPLVAALLLFVRAIARRFRAGEDDTRGYWIRTGAVAGLVAIAVQSIVEFSLQMPGNAALFVVLAAIALHRAPARTSTRPAPSGARA